MHLMEKEIYFEGLDLKTQTFFTQKGRKVFRYPDGHQYYEYEAQFQ